MAASSQGNCLLPPSKTGRVGQSPIRTACTCDNHVGLITSQGDQVSAPTRPATLMWTELESLLGTVRQLQCLGGAAADVVSDDLSPVTVIQELPDAAGVLTKAGPCSNWSTSSTGCGFGVCHSRNRPGRSCQQHSCVAGGWRWCHQPSTRLANPTKADFAPAPFLRMVLSHRPPGPPFSGGTAHDFAPGPGEDVFQRITVPAAPGSSSPSSGIPRLPPSVLAVPAPPTISTSMSSMTRPRPFWPAARSTILVGRGGGLRILQSPSCAGPTPFSQAVAPTLGSSSMYGLVEATSRSTSSTPEAARSMAMPMPLGPRRSAQRFTAIRLSSVFPPHSWSRSPRPGLPRSSSARLATA